MTGVDLLGWLPKLSEEEDFWTVLRSPDLGESAKLTAARRLAAHRLDFVATTKLDRAVGRLALPDGTLPRVKLAWLASSTIEQLVPATRIGCLRRGVLAEVWSGAYGQWRQQLLEDAGPLAAFGPDAILLTVHPHELLPQVPLAASSAEVSTAVEQRVAELVALWRRGRDAHHAQVIQETVPLSADPLFGSYDALVPGSPLRVARTFNLAMAEAAAAERVLLLDLDGWSGRLGTRTLFDDVRWHQAKQLVSPVHAPLYGDLVARLLAAMRGLSRKCLVVDLDNTLWGGVIGDDGLHGITLGQGSAVGEAFQAFQRYVKALGDRGVILAVCSKNDLATAEEAFLRHPEMVLRREDISAFAANWDDKATNLRRIAKQLDIGLDSLVLFDDNPAERALVRRELPEVAVPEVPEDSAAFTHALADAGYFEAVAFTTDDQARTAQYRENAQREEVRLGSTDMEGFLRGLRMILEVEPVDELSIKRVTQLVNKTNQWNLTTRRYSEEELRALMASPGAVALSARLKDAFGDNGLIAVLLARPSGERTLAIDTWLMSCRVLGRGVEKALFNAFAAAARAAGAEQVEGAYLPTAKNGLVRDLYESLGFERIEEGHGGPGSSRWRLALAEFRPFETCILPADLA